MKSLNIKNLKNNSLKPILLLLAIGLFTISCSKKDEPIPVVVDTKLALPASLENNTLLTVPDATQNTGQCGSGVNFGMAENTITIDKDGVISDASKVSLELDLSDVFAGEVVIELVSPSGNTCAVIKRIGTINTSSCGSDNDFVSGNKLTFNSAFTNTTIANPVATGNYAPLIGNNTFPMTIPAVPLNTFFNGKNIKGVWKIKAYDFGVGDILKVHSWKLKFEAGALQ